jgi:hypothetical protein
LLDAAPAQPEVHGEIPVGERPVVLIHGSIPRLHPINRVILQLPPRTNRRTRPTVTSSRRAEKRPTATLRQLCVNSASTLRQLCGKGQESRQLSGNSRATLGQLCVKGRRRRFVLSDVERSGWWI